MAQAAVRQVTSRACHYTLNSNLGSPLYDPAWLIGPVTGVPRGAQHPRPAMAWQTLAPGSKCVLTA